jgi:PAS domain-containing protein
MSTSPASPASSDVVIESERRAALRQRAAARLKGEAAAKGALARAADALSVLHSLASSPQTAPAALALLHELQVHQVEVDLQTQELSETRAELESALRRQIELYDFQPVGCFTIDRHGVLHELNLVGAQMLGIARDDAFGLRLDTFFCSESALRFQAVLSGIDAHTRQAPCLLKLCPKVGQERPVQAGFSTDPAGHHVLVALMEAAG